MSLASIQRINNISEIPGADSIERADVLGWQCVVKKGEFKPGDLCVFIEIDSLIPLSFLSGKPEDAETMHRLRTVKMKKQLSQGLLLPINIISNFFYLVDDSNYYKATSDPTVFDQVIVGDDVTEILGVKKYEKQIPPQLQGLAHGDFPGFLHKTDEINVQSAPELIEQLKGKSYYITVKCDGTSATYFNFNSEFGVCSRNLRLKDGDNTYWNLARKYHIFDWLPDGYAIQGEICGPGIQKNPLKLLEPDLFIFNVFDIKSGLYISIFDFTWNGIHSNILAIWTENIGGFKIVPIYETGEFFNYSLEDLLSKAKGNYDSGNRQEGIVVRSLDQEISFKVMNSEYLLKDEE